MTENEGPDTQIVSTEPDATTEKGNGNRADLPKLLYDKNEAAQILNVPKSSIEWLLRTGKLPRRKVAGKIRFTMADLQRYIDSSAVTQCYAADTERRST